MHAAARLCALAVAAVAAAAAGLLPAARAQLPTAVPVVVFTSDVPPFVSWPADAAASAEPTGYDVDFIREVLENLRDHDTNAAITASSVEFRQRSSIDDVITQVEAQNGSDPSTLYLGISSVTITASREQRIDFMPSYFQSGLQVMARSTNDFNEVAGRVVKNFFVALGLFTAAIVVLITVISPIAFAIESTWPGEGEVPLFWAEEEPGATRAYKMFWGVTRATMWTAFTLLGTQTGYPSGMPGRAIHGSLKIFRILLFVVATATFTNVFAVSTDTTDINGLSDLDVTVSTCTVAGTTSETFLRANSLRYDTRDSVDAMFDSFWDGTCEALVYDFPVLLGNIRERATAGLDADASTVGAVFQRENYGVLLPESSEWAETVGRAVLTVVGDRPFMDDLGERYLGELTTSTDNSLEVPTAWIVVPCLLGLVITMVVVALMYRHFEDKEGHYRTLKLNRFDRAYEDDYIELRQREVSNWDYLYGVDYISEVDLALSMRATRVLYERELRDKGIDIDACERQVVARNLTLRNSLRDRKEGGKPAAISTSGTEAVRVELPQMPESPDRAPAPSRGQEF